MRVASIGEITIDHYLDRNQNFIGGISLNFAVNAQRAGAGDVSLISRIGKDYSSLILQRLIQEGIDATNVAITEGKTAVQEIAVASNGERIFPAGGYHPGVLGQFRLTPHEIEVIQSSDVVASPCFSQLESLFDECMNLPFGGWHVADFLDLSDYHKQSQMLEKYLDRLTIAFVSGSSEMVEMFRPLSRKDNCLIVVTLGGAGSIALWNGKSIHQRALNVENPVDSTGCGDAFQAAFTVDYWKHRDITRALKSGASQAALALQHFGAIG